MATSNWTTVVKTLEVTDRDLTFLILGLKHFEEKLFADMGNPAGGELEDLLMVQWLQKKLAALKDKTPMTAHDGNSHGD